ncbi:hypothetical protein IGJ55_003060 [Enterococcus sp. AZ170]|uniref:polymorphic toxin type 44 domain-containing protein n=1 Tax=Enterococcus sp. AZ170 TaxID=2774747 RepID=UPI003D2FC917
MGLKIRVSEITSSPSFGTRNVNADDGSDLYTTADSLLDNVSQGLSALSSTNCFDGSNDTYSTAKLKLDWAKSINKEWKDNFVLPLDYAKLVQEIKDDKSLSPTEKAEKIARVYENYLYSLAKLAFDEYDKIRAKFGANSPEAIEAEKKLAGILQGLDIDIKAVTRNFGDNAIDVSDKNTLNYKQFIDMVNTAKPLDLKSRTFGDSDYSIWARGWSKGIEDRRDYLGNYLFGYYGQGALFFNGETLKMGAGVAQILSDVAKGDPSKLSLFAYYFSKDFTSGVSTWKANGYGDNEGDGSAVQEGIDDFKKYIKSK